MKKHLSLSHFSHLFLLLLSLLCLLLAVSCGKDPGDSAKDPPPPPSAGHLLYAARQSKDCAAPTLLFTHGEAAYEERFESLYHCAPGSLADGAIALSEGNTADEIAILRPVHSSGEEALLKMLRSHLQEEISVYESYSPADTAHLKDAQLFTKDGFVILIVSGDSARIKTVLCGYLDAPQTLPALPSDIGDASDTKDPSGDSSEIPAGSSEKPGTSDLPSESSSGASSENPTPVTPGSYPYAYPQDLPENGKKDVSYLADAIFIGDSRVEDLLTYLKPKTAGNYAYSALSVSAVFTKNLVKRTDGSSCTIAQALREQKGEFSKCYLCFGLNEIGWPYMNKFIGEYQKIIALVREVNPGCTIYVMNIYPVTASHSAAQAEENNENIRRFNDAIAEMAQKEKVGLVNVAAAVCDENCVLPEDAAGDGVHGNITLCRKLLDYLLTHTK